MTTKNVPGEQPDVVTFGETMVLLYAEDTGRLRHVSRFSRFLGGAESNVAVALRRLGVATGWFSRLGEDEFGAFIHNFLRGEGVDVSRTTFDNSHPTGVFFKEQSRLPAGEVLYYRTASAASTLGPEHIDPDYIKGAKHLHITGITLALSESCRNAVDYAISIARESGVRISLDANIRKRLWDPERWRSEILERIPKVDDVLLTDSEAQLITGTQNVDDSVRDIQKLGVSGVAIKHGSQGATLVLDGETLRQDAWQVSPQVQNHGAGDAFAAGIIAARVLGLDRRDTARLATLLGATATTVTGNVEALPTRDEVELLLNGKRPIAR